MEDYSCGYDMSDWLTNGYLNDDDDYSNLSLESFDDYDLDDGEVEEAPAPSELRISTITATGKITSVDSSGVEITKDDFLPISLEELYKEIDIDEKKGPFISIEYAENPIRGFDKRAKKKKKTKKTTVKKTKRKKFYNQSTILILMKNGNKVNLKIFRNGGIQMTGLKEVEEGVTCINEYIIPMFNKMSLKNKVIDKNWTTGEHKLELRKYNIVLINSDYTINFEIRRDVLHHILNTRYGILASFEADIYPGVNAKYYWNEDNNMGEFPGVCQCTKKCTGKGSGKGDGECKKVTISTFRSGSVIITGARNKKQIYDSYEFINHVFQTHYSELKKKEIKLEIPKSPFASSPKKKISKLIML